MRTKKAIVIDSALQCLEQRGQLVDYLTQVLEKETRML